MQVREIETAADVGRLREGFRQVFGGDISPAMLNWKYGQGRGRSWGAFSDDGTLLAHCGVMYREVLCEGQRLRVAQLVDLLATPARLDGLSRKQSVFFRLIEAVLDRVADVRNPDALCFGFPSDRAMRLGERLGVFAGIDRVHELTLPALSPARWAWWRVKTLSADQAASEAFTRSADGLWARMSAALGGDLVGVRDAEYLRHRYLGHPEHSYIIVCVRSCMGTLIAWAALRRYGGSIELMDVVTSMEDWVPVIQVLRRHLHMWDGDAFKLWVTEGQMKWMPAGMGFKSESLQFRIMANPRGGAGHAQRFAARWWLTSGDTDYR